METLSTTHPLSSLLLNSFTSTINPNAPLHLLKPSPASINNHHHHPTSLSNKTNHVSLTPLSSILSPTHNLLKFSTPQTHRKAATGYAAALLDVACCDGVLAAVAKDARRVKRIVKTVLVDERVVEGKKGEVVKRVVEEAGFYSKLVVLVKLLVRKGKVGVVEEVMEEFGRMWEELTGITRVIVVKDKRNGLVFERNTRFAM